MNAPLYNQPGQSRRQAIHKQWGSLQTERSTWLPHWRLLNDFLSPRSARFLVTDRNRGERRNDKIINETGTLALRTLASGMLAGITSPARPWFRLTLPDAELGEFGPVRSWLHLVEQRMREVYARSNVYNALIQTYADIGCYGSHAVAVVEDWDDVLRCYPFPVGSYALANSARLAVDTCCREYQLTVRQIVQQFVQQDPRSGSMVWDNVSTTVKNLWDRGEFQQAVDVLHYVAPNDQADQGRLAAKYKPYTSCYVEAGGSEDKLLRESGFDEFPILAPRWQVTGEDVYGESPGMQALGTVMQLQTMEKRKVQNIDKGTNPPLSAPSSLKNARLSLLPGDVTYADTYQGQAGVAPIYVPNPTWLQFLTADIREVENRIQRTFFEDLFLMLAMSDRREITAREIEERHEEKLLMLGPVLERLNDELLDPLIDRTFAIMLRRGMLPPPPKEIQGQALKVEYISIMAQAMRQVGIAAVDRLVGYVGNLAALSGRAEVWDKVNLDQSIDEMATMLGAPPQMLVADNEAAKTRAARAAQEQAMQALAAGSEMAAAAKNLSQAKTGEGSLLDQMAPAFGMPA